MVLNIRLNFVCFGCRMSAAGSASLEEGWLNPEAYEAFEQGTDITITFPDAQPAAASGCSVADHIMFSGII